VISWIFVKDTSGFVQLESETTSSSLPRLNNIFLETSFTNKNLSAVTQAGLVNNLNDGMVWGLLPIILVQKNFALIDIGIITSIYPAVWGLTQIVTGKLADIVSKKQLLFWGMLLQAFAIGYLIFAATYVEMITVSVLLGLGTAMVYPTFLATISDNTHAMDRAKSLGIFRFWRDSGYAIGAIITGITADYFGAPISIGIIASLTFFSAIFIKIRMN
jgi:MFS family permease